ncbi:MAG TPA: hypothetical protein GXZ45_07815 [Propionibacterium sp.]|nr:hypothetical protein [Propionibacterium sp.]
MKRSALAAAAVAVLTLTACGGDGGSAMASPGPSTAASPTALPTSTVTPSIAPTPVSTGPTTTPKAPQAPKRTAAPRTPQATPQSEEEIPGDKGEVPAGFLLPEEDRPGDDETTAFTTTVWRASCPDRVLTLASASGITATRIKESVGPEHVVGNGLLVFADEAAAIAFLDELGTQLAGCAEEGPNEEGWRTRQASGELDGFGDAGVQVRQWSEWDAEGTWVEAPGSGLTYLARDGQRVVLTYEGGEFQGDPANLPDLVTDSEARLAVMLDQL